MGARTVNETEATLVTLARKVERLTARLNTIENKHADQSIKLKREQERERAEADKALADAKAELRAAVAVATGEPVGV